MVKRRPLLGLGVTALTLGFAGCLGSLDPRREPDAWAGVDPRYPDDREVPPDASTHHLFVENADEESHVIGLTVVRTEDDSLIWRNTYEAPDGRGFEIPNLLVVSRTYEIRAAIEGGDEATTEREITPCPGAGGSRNVGVWIEGATVSFRQDVCDEIRVGTLSIGDHDSFARD